VWRELGAIPVTIVGSSAPPKVEDLASPLVDVAGWVEEIGPLIDSARVLVAPMSYGAGQKGKVTQSLAAGLPVVTTPIGAEGLAAVDGEQLLIGDGDAELSEHVVRVLLDSELWNRLSSTGQVLAETRCSPRLVTESMRELLQLNRRGSEAARGA
jgi:glycosyltransferase involved in cell wall biosynthesis